MNFEIGCDAIGRRCIHGIATIDQAAGAGLRSLLQIQDWRDRDAHRISTTRKATAAGVPPDFLYESRHELVEKLAYRLWE
jgi:hypothetical protein